MSAKRKLRKRGMIPAGRIPVPKKPPKVQPQGKDYKRKVKHPKPIDGADD